MSREFTRKHYYSRERERDRDYNRHDYRFEKRRRSLSRKRSRSPSIRDNRDVDRRRSRSPRKSEKDLLDENILSEISKLPEPSELWDNQIQEGGFTGHPPQTFLQEGNNYAGNYQPSYTGIYDDFPPVGTIPTAPHPPDMASWNQMSLPPPPAPPVYNVEEQIKKEAAIETEMRHQKAALSKQREEYIKKTGILKKELDTLKDQRNELRGDSKRTPSPDTKRFLKENTKLQLEIQNKLKTINNVVDMLNGIIGEEAQEIHESDESADRGSKRKSRSPSGKKFNYVYYDPEMHWCRVCNEFPPTAKEYLNHLHSPAHHKMAAAHVEAPWHSVSGVNEGFPSYPAAPTKRTPIRGLQFFVPSTAWYCKLCDQFIGDLHCASAHLKSVTHSKNYTNFVEHNPHWETDWMSDRQKAFEKARGAKVKAEDAPQYAAHTITFSKDGFTTRKVSPRRKSRKSKRKRSSSSDSSSSSAPDSEPKKKKKSKKSKSKYPSNDKLSEWMSSIQVERLNESDRKLLDNIKTRITLDKLQGAHRSEARRERQVPARDVTTREASTHGYLYSEQERRDDRREEPRRREERRDDRRDERREERDERRDERQEERDERREDRREDRDDERRSPPRQQSKKPEIRKMPFIGKMPVYKNLSKNLKADDTKKEELKKKEDEEGSKKRREEIDAEIQKKVAEFKDKIAKAQLDRQQSELAPPLLLAGLPPPGLPRAFLPAPAQPPPASSAPPLTLNKDFQDALDIIFPSEVKSAEMAQQELFPGLPGLPPPGFPPGIGLGGVIPSFPQLSILGQPPPHMMMGFDMNASLFQPRPQLYDTHVPIVPSPKQKQNNKNRQNQNKTIQDRKNDNQYKNTAAMNNMGNSAANHIDKHKAATTGTTLTAQTKQTLTASALTTKNKEELDDLAMLGIDADDVGAGI